jgi:hypothetical protein
VDLLYSPADLAPDRYFLARSYEVVPPEHIVFRKKL